MKRLLAAALFPASVLAADVTVNWDEPTQREDGTPVTTSEISGYAVSVTDKNTGTSNTVLTDNETTTAQFLDVDSGSYVVSVITEAVDGSVSEPAIVELDLGSDIKAVGNLSVDVSRKTVEQVITTIEETYRVE